MSFTTWQKSVTDVCSLRASDGHGETESRACNVLDALELVLIGQLCPEAWMCLGGIRVAA